LAPGGAGPVPYILGREGARFIKAMVPTICMASNSRAILLLGAALVLLSTALATTAGGGDYTLPIALVLFVVLSLLVFSLIMQNKSQEKGSTPIGVSRDNSTLGIESEVDDLPNPSDSGIDIPIL